MASALLRTGRFDVAEGRLETLLHKLDGLQQGVRAPAAESNAEAEPAEAAEGEEEAEEPVVPASAVVGETTAADVSSPAPPPCPPAPAGSSGGDATVADFPKGARVQVKGLMSTPQHNGKIGTVGDTSLDGTRLVVDLDGRGAATPLSLKPANLEPVSALVEAQARVREAFARVGGMLDHVRQLRTMLVQADTDMREDVRQYSRARKVTGLQVCQLTQIHVFTDSFCH
jgi:hypothetical protein